MALPDYGTEEPSGPGSIADRVSRARLDPPAGEVPVLETGYLSALVEGWQRPMARVSTLGRIVQEAFRLGRVSDCLAALAQQRDAAGTDPPAVVWALTSSSACRSVFGQLVRARADLAEVKRTCQYSTPLLAEPFLRFAETVCDWLEGNWPAAHASVTRLDENPVSQFPLALTGTVTALRMELLRCLGLPRDCRRLADRLPEAPAEVSAWALAGLDAGDGRPADALRRLADVCDVGERSPYRMALPFVLHRMAEIAFSCGDQDVTAFAAEALAGLDQAAPLNAILAGLARAYAASDPEPAARAQQLAEAEGAGMLVAEALTVRGKLGDAESLSAAHAAWSRIGAPSKARAVAAAMHAAGLPAPVVHHQARRVPARDQAAALTARERAMARLVHEGRTNQQIARALNVSVKTVEAYLTRVYRKTSCSSRVELAVAITQRRIQVGE